MTLKKHEPLKKICQSEKVPFINKTITKENMKQSRLRNKFFNTKNEMDRKAYNKQRNYCVTFVTIKGNIIWQY